MIVWRVTRTHIITEWAEVEAHSRNEAIAAYERREWIGDVGEEDEVEWCVEQESL